MVEDMARNLVPAAALGMTTVWVPTAAEWSKPDRPDDIAHIHHTAPDRSEEHTSELQSLMRISYAVFCLKKKKTTQHKQQHSKQAPRERKRTTIKDCKTLNII